MKDQTLEDLVMGYVATTAVGATAGTADARVDTIIDAAGDLETAAVLRVLDRVRDYLAAKPREPAAIRRLAGGLRAILAGRGLGLLSAEIELIDGGAA